MATEVPLPQVTLDLKFQEWLDKEEKSRRLIEEQRQRDRVAQREPSAATGNVPRASHVVPAQCVSGRPTLEDAPHNLAKEQREADKFNETIQYGAALSSFVTAVDGKPEENALAYLARQALLSQLPSVPTHKPGEPEEQDTLEKALAYLARQALLSQLPPVPTHKPGAPRT